MHSIRSDARPHPPALRRALFTAVLLGAAATSGCATKGDIRDVNTDLRAVIARQDSVLAELYRQRRLTADTLRTQSNQLTDLRGNVNQALRQILDELETLKEMTGQNQRTIASLRDQMVALQRSVRLGAPVDGGEPIGMERPADQTPQDMYNAALTPFNRGSTRSAEIGFQAFLRAYPGHELAPLAHYNLADVFVQEERFQEAVAEFEKIPERFPASDRVPQALYRIGLLYIDELGDEDTGERYLERVVNSYPNSPAADLARRALDGGGDPD